MASSEKKAVTRKSCHVLSAPELNSLLRLGHQVNRVKSELDCATEGGGKKVAIGLARHKLLESPKTNKNFRKHVAKKVDFGPQERIFAALTSLDLTETDNDVEESSIEKPEEKTVAAKQRDDEPQLCDFHMPFQGQDVASVQDAKTLQSMIDEQMVSLCQNVPRTRQRLQDSLWMK